MGGAWPVALVMEVITLDLPKAGGTGTYDTEVMAGEYY